MDLHVQKRLAADILNCGTDRVAFAEDRIEDIKQAITKRDLRLLIGEGAITRKPLVNTSRTKARKIQKQKAKGQRKGPGSRKGKFNARFHIKETWMNTIRVQRAFLKELITKGLITRQAYRELYLKSKGGYFRSKRHIKLYLEEHDELLTEKVAKTEKSAAASKPKSEKTRKPKAE